MSLGFEMMAAMPDEYLGDEPHEAYDSRPSRPITHWKTWNGKVIAIKDMTTLHLDNTIKFLKKQNNVSGDNSWRYANIKAIEKELKRRGVILR